MLLKNKIVELQKNRNWREKNKEHLKQYNKEYKQKNK